jgi:hypothetical protein
MQSNWEFPAQPRTVVLIAADLKWRELAQKTPECRDRQQGNSESMIAEKVARERAESGEAVFVPISLKASPLEIELPNGGCGVRLGVGQAVLQ